MNCTHESQMCFKIAIQAGILSEDRTADNYAGKYMYMGVMEDHLAFKHRMTREYIYCPADLIKVN